MKRVLFEGTHLWNVHAIGDGFVFEQGMFDAPPLLFHVVPGSAPRHIATLPAGRPRGVLRAVEDDRLICLEVDGALSAIDLHGRRNVIRRLVPSPVAVAIAPEQVVWATAETRFLDGGESTSVGQVWRWWRGTDDVELLGEQPALWPNLIAGGISTGPNEMTAPVFISANHDLGVIETPGMRWLARCDQPITHLAGSAEGIIYTSQGQVMRRDHRSGATEILHRETIPMGLAVHDGRLLVTRNYLIDRRVQIEDSALSVIDLGRGTLQVLATQLGRPGSLAVSEHGIALVESSPLEKDEPDRLVLIDWP